MNSLDKIRVAVLYGGRSAEHEVSLRSAANVMQYLDSSRFEVVPIGIDKQGNWFLGDDVYRHSLIASQVSQLTEHSTTWFTPEWVGKSVQQQDVKTVLHQQGKSMFDVIFPAVHGSFCEDGTLQGLLELANVPYVGCGVLASSVGMDKDVSKRLAMLADVNVAPYLVIRQDDWLNNISVYAEQIEQTLFYPVFVKPANTGSSIGITKVKNAADLASAVKEAFHFDTKVIIEKALEVIELEVAVLESLTNHHEPVVSTVGQINPTHEFYSYDAKYTDDQGAELLIPAPLSEEKKKEVQHIAKTLFLALECEGMARVDLFLEKSTQRIFFNEVNTLPGFTQISMYPKLMDATGIGYTDLLTHLIQLAIKRHQQKNKLVRSYADLA